MKVVRVPGYVHVVPVVVIERTVRVPLDQVCSVAQVRDVVEVAAEGTKRGGRKGLKKTEGRKCKLIVFMMKNNTGSHTSGHYNLSCRNVITRAEKELHFSCLIFQPQEFPFLFIKDGVNCKSEAKLNMHMHFCQTDITINTHLNFSFPFALTPVT